MGRESAGVCEVEEDGGTDGDEDGPILVLELRYEVRPPAVSTAARAASCDDFPNPAG